MPFKNPERRREYQREWVKRNNEKHREQSRQGMARWRLRRPDARLARDRAYRRRHPDQQNAYQRRWIRAHPEVRKAAHQLRRAREVGAGGRFIAKEWRSLVLRYESRCAYCGTVAPLEADHRTPLSRGGSNSVDNILPACGPCNRKKRNRTEEEFKASRGDNDAA